MCTVDQTYNSQKTPHTSPSRASYGVSIVSILRNIDRVITELVRWVLWTGIPTAPENRYSNKDHITGRAYSLVSEIMSACHLKPDLVMGKHSRVTTYTVNMDPQKARQCMRDYINLLFSYLYIPFTLKYSNSNGKVFRSYKRTIIWYTVFDINLSSTDSLQSHI